MSVADPTAYDIFLSYSRKDNAPITVTHAKGWVTAIRDHILADHRRFSTEPLRIFFDTDEIKDIQDRSSMIAPGNNRLSLCNSRLTCHVSLLPLP